LEDLENGKAIACAGNRKKYSAHWRKRITYMDCSNVSLDICINCGNQHRCNELLSYISEAVRLEQRALSSYSGRIESSLRLTSLSGI